MSYAAGPTMRTQAIRATGCTNHRDWCMRQPRYHFLDVANALDRCDRRSKCGVIPEVQVPGVVEALPLFLRE
jgi:hypothetical protein